MCWRFIYVYVHDIALRKSKICLLFGTFFNVPRRFLAMNPVSGTWRFMNTPLSVWHANRSPPKLISFDPRMAQGRRCPHTGCRDWFRVCPQCLLIPQDNYPAAHWGTILSLLWSKLTNIFDVYEKKSAWFNEQRATTTTVLVVLLDEIWWVSAFAGFITQAGTIWSGSIGSAVLRQGKL